MKTLRDIGVCVKKIKGKYYAFDITEKRALYELGNSPVEVKQYSPRFYTPAYDTDDFFQKKNLKKKRPDYDIYPQSQSVIRKKKKSKGKSKSWAKKRATVYERDGYKCLKCGLDNKKKLTLDHIVPKSKGGSNDIDNLQTMCKPCNLAKADNIMDYRNLNK